LSDQRDAGRDALMSSIGELKGTVGGIAQQMNELRANAVTKEMLDAKIGPTTQFVRGLIALVLLTVGGAILAGVITSRGAQTPDIQIIVPTAPAVTSAP
jgi:hypothetical protein